MKKYMMLTLILVLTAVLFVGCGCTGRNTPTIPTTMPSMTTTPTQETTRATTAATTEPTVDRGNGPTDNHATDDSTALSTDSTMESTNDMARRAEPTIR